MSEVIIKKGKIKTILDRTDLVDVAETPDGVNFTIKGGLVLSVMDPDMPSATKQVIKNTADSFPGKKLIFDLANYKRPAMVDAT
jgi:hypothetical protein